MNYTMPVAVLTLRQDEWQILIDGEVLPHIWNGKEAALAGLDVECRRRNIHKLSKDCWCNPTKRGAQEQK